MVGLLLAAQLARAAPQLLPNEKTLSVPSRPGATISFLALSPQTPPRAGVILFAGGDGIIGNNQQNFLLRVRGQFAAAGFLVVSLGMPSDHRDGLNAKTRSAPDYAQDVAATIAWMRQHGADRIWLIGTSTGTISAANAASRLKPGTVDGLVMTSSFVPTPGGSAPPIDTWVSLPSVAVPTLFVHNREDACATSPFANLQRLIDEFRHAPVKDLIAVSGGAPPTSGPCDAMSRHGYFGLEDQVVKDIVSWIAAH